MDRKVLVSLAMVSLLLIASAPLASAYKGHQLSRAEVVDFTLVDQNNENFTFSQSYSDVHVIAFVFTRCPDVCPVITQSLKLVEDGLSDEDAEKVEFVSITVDPSYDTPEQLKLFTEYHNIDWPHLTGDKEVLQDVYNSFGIIVEEEVIEAHIANADPTVTFVDLSGNSTETMFAPNGWTMNEIIAEEANWTINATYGQYGHLVSGINGVESPSDWSWYWSLNVFNDSSQAWEESMVGIDSIDAMENSNLLWAASTTNISQISAPEENDSTPSVTVLYPDNSTVNHSLQTDFNAYHLTKGAFSSVGMNTTFDNGNYGHMLTSIDEVSSPSDWSWYWSLYVWNTTSNGWDVSTVGVDDLVDPTYIAWAPNSTSVSDIPMPESLRPTDIMAPQVCNGYGWEMGSGEGKHCMCDEGYEWGEGDRLSCVAIEETEVEYSVGHSTITFIMDGMKPKIAWSGDSWKADDFRADVEQVISSQSSPDSSEPLPGMTFFIAVTGLTFAAAVVHIGSRDEEEEA